MKGGGRNVDEGETRERNGRRKRKKNWKEGRWEGMQGQEDVGKEGKKEGRKEGGKDEKKKNRK